MLKMDGLLNEISKSYRAEPGNARLQPLTKTNEETTQRKSSVISTLEEALEQLKTQPDYDTLIEVLDSLPKPHPHNKKTREPDHKPQKADPGRSSVYSGLIKCGAEFARELGSDGGKCKKYKE